MAGDLDTLLNRLGGRDVVLVGWSLGGSVAMAYLRKHDHTRIKALVLIDSATGSSSSPALLQRRADFIERLRRDREATLHNLVVSMFRKPQSETLIDNLTTACMRMPIEHSINLLLGEHDVESWNPKDRDLQLPILYLASPGYAEAGRWMKKRSPTTRLEVYQRSGHGFFLEEPDLFEKSVRRFLSSIPKDPGGKP
jgi:pimeloyl-ACP methyl ester carboxylesterase